MKVLLVHAKRQLAEALSNRCDVEAVEYRTPDSYALPRPSGSRVTYHEYDEGMKFSLRSAWQLRQIIEEVQPDIVHAFYGRSLAHTVLATTAMRRRPRIVSFRGITSCLSSHNLGDWISYSHRHVDAHACESDAVRDALITSRISPKRCQTTYNVMLNRPQCRPGRGALAQFDVPADAFVVGTMAAMRPVKGIDLLLQAAIDCADLENVYWVLFGKVVDPVLHELAADERIRDRVRLVGYRDDCSDLISGADLFVMPSRAEALCQGLLESMHQGVCPVVSDAGGMKEAVRHEQDGLVVPTEDVAALSQAIRRLEGDRTLTAQLATSARQRIADQFTAERMAERTLAIYEKLIGSQRTRMAA